MDLNAWMQKHRQETSPGSGVLMVKAEVKCRDGTHFSVQASKTHYCTPQDDFFPYSQVEVYSPTRLNELGNPSEVDTDKQGNKWYLYAWADVDAVEEAIHNHGGMPNED